MVDGSRSFVTSPTISTWRFFLSKSGEETSERKERAVGGFTKGKFTVDTIRLRLEDGSNACMTPENEMKRAKNTEVDEISNPEGIGV